jgi:uncharacterized protein YggU (UPF0235/DUF167 family)
MTTLLKILVFTMLAATVQCNIGNYNTIKGEGEVIEEEFELSDFDEVSFANGWDVELIPSSSNKLTVKANENLVEILKIDQDNRYLKVGTDSNDNIGKADAKLLTVYYSGKLNTLKASSGVKLFSAEQLEFNDVKISSSSGSSVELNVKTDNLDCGSSSGSKMMLKISSTNVSASSSSGSDLELAGKSKSMIASSSSGSSCTLSGYTEALEVDSSSGSKIDAQELKAVNVTASASSGSGISVFPVEVLDAKSSSGGSIKYYNNPSVDLKRNESSGGSVRSN